MWTSSRYSIGLLCLAAQLPTVGSWHATQSLHLQRGVPLANQYARHAVSPRLQEADDPMGALISQLRASVRAAPRPRHAPPKNRAL